MKSFGAFRVYLESMRGKYEAKEMDATLLRESKSGVFNDLGPLSKPNEKRSKKSRHYKFSHYMSTS